MEQCNQILEARDVAKESLRFVLNYCVCCFFDGDGDGDGDGQRF